MQQHRFAEVALACLVVAFVPTMACGAIVSAGKHFLMPNAPGQLIGISITGGEAVAGVELFVQIGDGGAAAGGDDVGPTISALDLGGTGIFAANNTGVFVDSSPLLWGATTTTQTGTVAAAGRLATLTVSTVGFAAGRYDLILNPPAAGPTQFPGVATSLVNGWIQIGSPRAADFNEDGEVDAADLGEWESGFGLATATHLQGDADEDQDVDGADFLTWQRQLETMAPNIPSAAVVPEPATLLLLLLAASTRCWIGRRRLAQRSALCLRLTP